MTRYLSASDATFTSLTPELSSILYYLRLHSGMDTKRPFEREFVRYVPSPFYPASVVLFQLHGGMVSHMQVLVTHSSTVHSTKFGS